ncbi:MAG TPA: hypothetical protein VFN23_02220, partial [Ktedonobacteraceae bacterium]|nr:hypothetical protein [Ktedonobacteraceae bacterium]
MASKTRYYKAIRNGTPAECFASRSHWKFPAWSGACTNTGSFSSVFSQRSAGNSTNGARDDSSKTIDKVSSWHVDGWGEMEVTDC